MSASVSDEYYWLGASGITVVRNIPSTVHTGNLVDTVTWKGGPTLELVAGMTPQQIRHIVMSVYVQAFGDGREQGRADCQKELRALLGFTP